MTLTKRPFGTLPDGTDVTCYTMTADNGFSAEILDYGATIRALTVPDRNGKPVDVVLGYDTLEEYCKNEDYLGATIGRFANRIGKGRFELNGKEYVLALNNGKNHLHGGKIGFDKKVWATELTETGITFSILSPDGEEGYPGNLQTSVTMSWKGNGLELHYKATTDQDTILNLTNHSYFNLDGEGTVREQTLQIAADSFTNNDSGCLPTGEILPVAGTAMDFRKPRAIGDGADSDEPCIRYSKGYDVNFVFSGSPAVIAESAKSGIVMTMTTDQPGMQLYTANLLSDRKGKNGARYGFRSGFCLETQHYPDCIHHPEWPSCVLRAGEVFESTTTYSFSVK